MLSLQFFLRTGVSLDCVGLNKNLKGLQDWRAKRDPKAKFFLCSPSYGSACRWAMVAVWLAAVLSVIKRSFSTTAREGRRATGPSVIGVKPLKPILASGPVGTAVLGWLFAQIRIV